MSVSMRSSFGFAVWRESASMPKVMYFFLTSPLLPLSLIHILNGIAAMDHDPITNIDADVRHTGGVIRSDEKDEITGLCVRL